MNTKDLWLSIIKNMLEELGHAQIITWFKNTTILTLKDGVITIGLPTEFFLKWHAGNFSKTTLKAAQEIDPTIKSLNYVVDLTLTEANANVIDLLQHFSEKPTSRKVPKKNEVKYVNGIISKIFNPNYTLESFITAPENHLAHAACQNVGKYPGQNYNPLFIYGGVGLGKTHLLQATGNAVLRNNPKAIVIYTTTESFVNEVVTAIRSGNTKSLHNRYRQVDTLIIDDIQFIANKDRCQEEFFHTFNTLYEANKQIIISSDKPPHELTLLEERLISRFESGMIVDVKMPEYETRLAILQNKCQEAQAFINQEVLEFIALNITNSIRTMEGFLKQVIAKYELEHIAPTVKLVADMMRKTKKEIKMIGLMPTIDSEPNIAITIDRLMDSVADYFAVTKTEMIGTSRVRELMVPRQVTMYLAKTKLNMSLTRIGSVFGKRNHTTVMHAVNRIKDQLKNDRHLLRDLNAITKEVGIY